MSAGRARGAVGFFAAASVLFLACAPEDPEGVSEAQPASTDEIVPATGPRSRVLARVGRELPLPPGATELRRVLLGESSRPGFCAPLPFEFELVPPEGAASFSFAAGARSRRNKDGEVVAKKLAVEVIVKQAGRSRYRAAIVESGGWRTVRLPLEEGEGALRVEARGRGELCWGSIDFEGAEASEDAKRTRPNVVLFSLDTLGAPYLSSHRGIEDVSPRLDAFLGEAFEFRRGIAQFGQTLVSHSSLFSGQYPRVHRRYASEFTTKTPTLDTLMAPIAAAGYRTGAFTENGYMSSHFGFDTAFDFYDNGPDHVEPGRGHARETFRNAQQWLREEGKNSRFFLFVHTYEVHSPYVPDTPEGLELANELTPGDRRVFTNDQTHTAFIKHLRGEAKLSARERKRLLALYNAEIAELDELFGELMDTLAALGLEEDTLVVVTADHGEIFGEKGAYAHGVTLHNKIVNVPLAFRWPARIAAGRSEQPVQLVDGLVTVLDLLGLDPPEVSSERTRAGRSLRPLLLGETGGLEAAPAFSDELRPRPECRPRDPDPACWVERYAVQSRRYKLVRSRDGSYERFYDLDQDPNEIRNASSSPANQEALRQHRRWLDGYLASTPEIPFEGLRANDPKTKAEAAAPDDLDPEMRARLEALGYVF